MSSEDPYSTYPSRKEESFRSMGLTLVCSSLSAYIPIKWGLAIFVATIPTMLGFNAWHFWPWTGLGFACLFTVLYAISFGILMISKDARESAFGVVPSEKIGSHEVSLLMSSTVVGTLFHFISILPWSFLIYFTQHDTANGLTAGTFESITADALPFATLSLRGIITYFIAYGFSMATIMVVDALSVAALLYFYTSHPPTKVWQRIRELAGKRSK